MARMPISRLKKARRLASFLKAHGPLIASRLEPRMAAVLEEGEAMPDLAHLLDVLGRIVAAEWKNVDEKDRQRSRDGAQANWVRHLLRQQAKPLLRSRVQDVRRRIKGFLSPEDVEFVTGGARRTPRSDEGLEDLADVMVRRLAAMKPVASPAGEMHPAGLAKYLLPALEDATDLMAELEGRTFDESDSVGDKTAAMRAFDKLFRRVARVGRIFCEMTGLGGILHGIEYKGGRPSLKQKIQKERERGPGVA